MPRRNDLKKVMIIGSGPIVIGQACEFDYSGTQACKALREEGYRVVLVNSNPATIMTDPEIADATYIEPLTVEFLEKVIIKEKPDAVLPTMGGQTGLNLAVEAYEAGVFTRHHVEMIGDEHQVAGHKVRVDRAGRIRHHQELDPQALHDAHRQVDLCHAITFVKMDAPLHHQYRLTFKHPHHQTA